jgi:hypothetical protein
MSTNPVVWFEIYVADLDRARRFYEAVLATKLQALDSPDPSVRMLAFGMQSEAAGASGALVHMKDGPKPGGGGTMVYFACADCAVEAGRVAANGGTLFKPKFPIGTYGHIAIGADLDGNMIGFHSMA